MHPYVSQALIGRFNADLAHVSADEIRTQAQQHSRPLAGRKATGNDEPGFEPGPQ